jgi:ribosomal protein S18 acetylase RimI-like enzyme
MTLHPRPVTPDDADAVAALMTRIAADHPTGFELSAAEVVELLSDYPGLVFEGGWEGEELAAYTTVMPQAASAGVHPFLFFGDVDPAHLGRGFGTHMLERAVATGREIHWRESPEESVRFGTRAFEGRDDQADLLRSHGFVLDRHNFLMFSALAGLPTPVLPGDLVLGIFDPADAEELRTAQNEAFADYPSYTDVDQLNWAAFMVAAAHVRNEQSFVLRDPTRDNAVAAYVFTHEYAIAPSGEQGREAYVAYVGTLPGYRGRGLATNLLAHTLHACKAAGFDTSSLDVDTANPAGALGIYERAGYSVRYRQDNYALVE